MAYYNPKRFYSNTKIRENFKYVITVLCASVGNSMHVSFIDYDLLQIMTDVLSVKLSVSCHLIALEN